MTLLSKPDPTTGKRYLLTRKRLGRLPRTHCKTRLIWHSLTGRFAAYEALVCPRCGKIVSTRKKLYDIKKWKDTPTTSTTSTPPTPIELDKDEDD